MGYPIAPQGGPVQQQVEQPELALLEAGRLVVAQLALGLVPVLAQPVAQEQRLEVLVPRLAARQV